MSRRDFGAGVGAVCAGLALAGCTDGDSTPIQTGGLGGNDSPPPDAPTHTTNPDANMGGTCGSGATDVGAPSTFTTAKPVYNSTLRAFIVRDAGGLFAVSALCTHEGAVCTIYQKDFECPRHGALFTWTGAVVSGPVYKALSHYAMCSLPNGNVGVVRSQVVDPSTRLKV